MFGKTTSASAQKAPISSHPIFPVVVAIWFAALLGIGSLILPVILFEKIFEVTGIASLVPAAQAPLGFTARMLIAIAAATGGAIAGVLVARKVAASQSVSKGTRLRTGADASENSNSESKRPISAMEELGSDSLDEPIADEPRKQDSYKGKRRSLAVTDESGPSDFLELAPLPGGDIAFDEGSLMSSDDRHQPLDLDEFADESDDADDAELMAELNGPFARPAAEQQVQSAAPTGVDFAAIDTPETFRPAVTQPQSETPAAETLREELATMTEPTDQNPASDHDFGAYNPLADKRESGQQFAKPFSPAPPVNIEPQVKFATPVAPAAMPAPKPVAQAQAERSDQQAKPLNELGMVELVERFASALQSKRIAPEAAPQMAPAPVQHEAVAPVQPPVAEPVETPASFQSPAIEQPQPAPQPAPVEPAAEPSFAAATEPAASPLVFRRASAPQSVTESVPESIVQQPAAESPASFAAPAAQHDETPSIPSALQPLGFDDGDDDEAFGDSPNLGLSLEALRNPEPQQAAEPAIPAPFSAPEPQTAQQPTQPPQATPEPTAEPEYAEAPESDDSYSSLLNMRNALGASREFVRIEEDDAAATAEPVVVFPGQDRTPAQPGQAATEFAPQPAATDAARPFDGPVAQPVRKSGEAVANAGETERALREALEKLQRMSGAA